jgi:hypothetical protein
VACGGIRPRFEETFVFRHPFAPGALALALCIATNAFGATDAELAQIRDEIRALKESYEARIQALERRLKEAEAAPAPVPAAPAAPSGGASAFNPTISAILNGTYAHLPRAGGPVRRGFGLGESELVLSANVDPSFAGTLNLSASPEDTISVEEAYGQWLTAPFGLSPKFGRFLSGLGYLNEQHPHAWDFVDPPLAYERFLGGQYAQDGVQVKWIAPLDQYVELGAEAGNGSGFPGSDRDRNGAGSSALYAHTGGDIGSASSWRAGLSYLRTRSEDDLGATAASRLGIADFVWKVAPGGSNREGAAKVQGEYFRGTVRDATRQSGWYLQGVYQFLPEWRVGARYDRVDAQVRADTEYARRASAMVDYNPSEFTRIRLQFSRAGLPAGNFESQWFLQYILSLGAHGAHKY